MTHLDVWLDPSRCVTCHIDYTWRTCEYEQESAHTLSLHVCVCTYTACVRTYAHVHIYTKYPTRQSSVPRPPIKPRNYFCECAHVRVRICIRKMICAYTRAHTLYICIHTCIHTLSLSLALSRSLSLSLSLSLSPLYLYTYIYICIHYVSDWALV